MMNKLFLITCLPGFQVMDGFKSCDKKAMLVHKTAIANYRSCFA